MKEVQELSIMPTVQYEKTRVTIENPDDQDYIISFKSPLNLKKIIPSKKIKGRASPAQFRNSIKGFWRIGRRLPITVTRESVDVDGKAVG